MNCITCGKTLWTSNKSGYCETDYKKSDLHKKKRAEYWQNYVAKRKEKEPEWYLKKLLANKERWKSNYIPHPKKTKSVEEKRDKRIKYYSEHKDYFFKKFKERYSTELNTLRLRKYRQTPEGKKAVLDAVKRSIERYPHKQEARVQLNWAIKTGKLIKPNTCQDCFEEKLLHGHHDDYSRPLEVKWLCALCHNKLHRSLQTSNITAII